MKRFAAIAILLLALCSCAFARGQDMALGPDKDAKKDLELLNSRAALLWIDGRKVGDLIVGAKAKMQFELIDDKLARRIYAAQHNFPEPFVKNVGFYDKAKKQKCALIIMPYSTVTQWDFDPYRITVNGEYIPKNKFYTSLLSKTTGRLYEFDEDTIAFGIPREIAKPGMTLVFGYDGYSVELVVPKGR